MKKEEKEEEKREPFMGARYTINTDKQQEVNNIFLLSYNCNLCCCQPQRY
jgi:hypothetical protein